MLHVDASFFTDNGSGRGFTLIELTVVLVLIGLALAIVAPAVLPPQREETSGLGELLSGTRDLAARRGETLFLNLDGAGGWTVHGAASRQEGILATGRLEEELPHLRFVVSAIGTCSLDVASSMRRPRLDLDPLTCSVRADDGAAR